MNFILNGAMPSSSATVLFLVSAAIMASAAGTLHIQGIYVDNAIEMVSTLEPLAGRFAIALFVTGIIAAGLSSIFPNMLLLPWLISDYRGTPRDLTSKLFRFLVILVTLIRTNYSFIWWKTDCHHDCFPGI